MSPTEVLLAIGAAQGGTMGYSAVVDLSEHQLAAFDLPPGLTNDEVASLYAVLTAPSLQDLLTVTVVHRADGRPQLLLVTDSRVGFGSAGGGDRLFVRVRPKVDARRFLELAYLAGVLPNFDVHTDVSVADFADILRWMLELLVRGVEDVIRAGGLRPTHERVDRVLRNRVRGKLLIPAFMGSLAKGRPDRIPCQFSALEIDNPANRLLKWALSVAGRMLRELDRDAEVEARVDFAMRRFGDVPLVRPSVSSLRREMILPPNQRHYGDAVRIARLLLSGLHVDSSPGVVSSISLTVDMNIVFERAFWNLFRQHAATAQAKPSWRVDFAADEGPASVAVSFRPDIFVRSSDGSAPLVIDTKWKDAARSYQTDVVIRPSTSDVYQVAAYAGAALRGQSTITKCLAVLMYPSLVDCTILKHRIHGGGFETIVVLMGWNVTRPPHETVGEVWSYLDELRTMEMPTAPGEIVVERLEGR